MFPILSSEVVRFSVLQDVWSSKLRKDSSRVRKSAVSMVLTVLLLSVVTVLTAERRNYPRMVSIQSVFPEQSTLILHVPNIPLVSIQR